MKRVSSQAARAELRSQIRAVGLRSTAPRVAVLEHLQAATTPLSHAEIFDVLEDQGFDRATIYRNLADLTEAKLLSRTDVGDHVWRFERRRDGQRGSPKEHPHFMCVDCGEVACLPGINVRISATVGAPRAIATKSVAVQLKGRCDRCAA